MCLRYFSEYNKNARLKRGDKNENSYIHYFFIYMSLNTLSTTNYTLKTELQDVPPKFYSLPNGQISGISFDIMELIEKSSKYRFNYEKKSIPISRIIVNLEKKNKKRQ